MIPFELYDEYLKQSNPENISPQQKLIKRFAKRMGWGVRFKNDYSSYRGVCYNDDGDIAIVIAHCRKISVKKYTDIPFDKSKIKKAMAYGDKRGLWVYAVASWTDDGGRFVNLNKVEKYYGPLNGEFREGPIKNNDRAELTDIGWFIDINKHFREII